MVSSGENILSVNISVDYPGKKGVLRDVALDIAQGEILGLVGESGSGKSTLSLAILGLLNLKGGTARGNMAFLGRELTTLSEREMRSIRGRQLSLVLQSPHSSLNPALKIGDATHGSLESSRAGQPRAMPARHSERAANGQPGGWRVVAEPPAF